MTLRTYTAQIHALTTVQVETDDETQVERLAVAQVKAKLGDCVAIVTGIEYGQNVLQKKEKAN